MLAFFHLHSAFEWAKLICPTCTGEIGAICTKIIIKPLTNCPKLSHHAHGGEREGKEERREEHGCAVTDMDGGLSLVDECQEDD